MCGNYVALDMNKRICREEIPIWVPFNGTDIPKEAVRGGWSGDQSFFIGRAPHNGSVTPGKIFQDRKVLSLPWGTIENIKSDFEVLTRADGLNWVAAKDGAVPPNAFPGGHSEEGETLYIGRVLHNDIVSVGKIQPGHRVCYVTHNGMEINFKQYEVLVV